jgi:2-polyprenyl-6-methoxyphenol hydroxylase-like FAD-dependent oxidoreductase
MKSECDVVVVGGGVGGLACALAFASAHALRVRVIERRAGPGNINRGDSLLPAVTRLLRSWGALDRFRAAGANPIDRMQVFHARGGLLLEAPLEGPGGDPYLVFPHPEIERTLAEAGRATGRVEVSFQTSLRRLVETDGRVRGVTVVDAKGNEETIHARLVVGADGSSSRVRELLDVPFFSVPYDTGYFIVDLTRPAAYRDAMRLDLHPEGGVMTMPQSPGMVGVAALVLPAQLPLFQSGTEEQRLAAIWRRAPILEGMRYPPKGAHLYRLHRGHATRYHAHGAVLIGDAVHVTNPTAGQGMTMALEDAAELARQVGPLLETGANPGAVALALERYEATRRPRNLALVRWSDVMGRVFALRGELGDEVRRRMFAFGTTPLGKLIQQRVWSRVATRGAA